jgi:hypothetical protein
MQLGAMSEALTSMLDEHCLSACVHDMKSLQASSSGHGEMTNLDPPIMIAKGLYSYRKLG